MGRSLGRSVREFKKASDTARKEFGVDEIEREIKDVKNTLVDVKGDLKVDVDAEAARPAAAAATGVAAVTAAASAEPVPGDEPASGAAEDGASGGEEILVGDVVDEGASDDEVEIEPVEEAVIDEPAPPDTRPRDL
jgi:Sec-independent protein translocase protein TatA